ncbi:unnamed protein product [Mytilus edulis]|uniref:Reverse transcriptase/retrotransposon-derived protein RNase H-like domain-containing protein n=1 Tax=Mytilus edulis TaxID=6550 RepID=A0A8S3U237_MYTED|nr:unnamed protein product [Mytilus edulis]
MVPPRHEAIIKSGLTNKAKYRSVSSSLGILTPERPFLERLGLALAKTLVDSADGVVYTRVYNPGSSDVIVYRHTHLALFTPVCRVGPVIDMNEMSNICEVEVDATRSTGNIPEHLRPMFEIGCRNLDEKQAELFKNFLDAHQECFAQPGEVGRTNMGTHKIKLRDDKPIREPHRRIPMYKRQALEDEVRKKYVKDFSKIAKPLFDLTKKNQKFAWNKGAEAAFLELKSRLISAPILGFPQADGSEFILDTDASAYAIGAVLSQIQDGKERVIAYGRPFRIRTDHGSLTWLQNFREPDGQIHRWIQQLSQFHMKIEHRPGVRHGNADAMSRLVTDNGEFCKQCEMPWGYGYEGPIETEIKYMKEGDEKSIDVVSENSDSHDDHTRPRFDCVGNNDTDVVVNPDSGESPLVRRGRKSNRPKIAQQKPMPNIDLRLETVRARQEADIILGENFEL